MLRFDLGLTTGPDPNPSGQNLFRTHSPGSSVTCLSVPASKLSPSGRHVRGSKDMRVV